ncbi:hypothetical protein CORC01_05046 [Colletotrichum orchidophilum]|uniref:Uncharacterized protein n=1 Tax=Colletotrichum orchidophilum TaxID=1209926 RepID=A0A1G4BE97_9PEZI|nr:uncharacterized protein CORC01_05046 [Colletotrichum orchidophilum]OHE99688.1 hypothetical protein CORC01_05046 [Colletotrichum orchidophilum]
MLHAINPDIPPERTAKMQVREVTPQMQGIAVEECGFGSQLTSATSASPVAAAGGAEWPNWSRMEGPNCHGGRAPRLRHLLGYSRGRYHRRQ